MKHIRTIFLILLFAWSAPTEAMTLEALMQKTVEENPDVQQARLNLEKASGRRLVLRSVGLPDAAIGVVAGDQGGHRSGENSNQPFAFPYAGFTQPFFNAAVPPSFRRGDLEVLIAQQQLNVAVTNQLHGARLAFYTALYNRSLGKIRSEQLQQLTQNAVSQKERYESGLVKRDVLVGSEIQAGELDPQVGASERAYSGALLKLAEAIGEDLGPSATLPEPVGELKYVPIQIDLSSEVSRTLRRRPDLELARLLVRAGKEDERIMEAAYYPTANIVISGYYIPVTGVRRVQAVGSPRRSDDFISSEILAGGAYTWRVIDNGKVYGAVKRQRSAREINELLLHKMEQDIPREMSRIQHDLQAIAAKRELLSSASTAAEQNATTVQQNLGGGLVTQLDFRQAENALLEIKSGLLTLAYQENIALAEWDRASGRYLQFSTEVAQNVP